MFEIGELNSAMRDTLIQPILNEKRLIICPAPFTVATVNSPEDLVSPTSFSPTVQPRHKLAKYSDCPLHSRRSTQSLLALALHCQSYVPR